MAKDDPVLVEYNVEDAWIHRSEHMRCVTCMWYSPKVQTYDTDGDPEVDFGRCRRHSPTMSGFPAVFGSDWCGDHKLDENSLL